MALEQNIIPGQWYRFEAKSLAFTVTDSVGAAVNLSAVTCEWSLYNQAGGIELLTKTPVISGAGNNIATVSIAVADYTTPTAIPAGNYWHELFDRTNDVLLAYGTAHIGNASA